MSATAKAKQIESIREVKNTDERLSLTLSLLAGVQQAMTTAFNKQDDRLTVCFGELETQIRDVQEDVASLRRQISEFRAWVNGVVTAQTEMADIINLAQKALESGKPRRKK